MMGRAETQQKRNGGRSSTEVLLSLRFLKTNQTIILWKTVKRTIQRPIITFSLQVTTTILSGFAVAEILVVELSRV